MHICKMFFIYYSFPTCLNHCHNLRQSNFTACLQPALHADLIYSLVTHTSVEDTGI